MNERANGTSAGSSGQMSLAVIAGRVAHAIDSFLPPGDVAELRRLTGSDPATPAFFKLMAAIVDPEQKLPPGGQVRDQIERRWAVLFQAAAVMRGLHSPVVSLGRALAQAEYSELRFVRLLRSNEAILPKEIRTSAQFLATKAQPCSLADYARLLMIKDNSISESVRRSIARDYYRFEKHDAKEN